ncbi:MAG: histidine ammonia-lyase [Eubacteriales bacterium]
MEKVIVNGNNLTLEELIKVARGNCLVEISKEAIKKVVQSRDYVENLIKDGKVVYGITTGFGKFSNIVISKDQVEVLQESLIRSHACGVGNHFPEEVVRAIMLIRLNASVKGYSGIRVETLHTLAEMINKRVHPAIPEKGSLGSSGDLAPLSHMVLVLMGEGEAYYENKLMKGSEAMALAGIKPVRLTSKEGLALINGTQVLTAVGAIATYDAINLMKYADISAALTFEALRGITAVFDEKIHAVRNHKGQMDCAKNLARILEGSGLTTKEGEIKIQDSYSLRCLPQIHGASKDAIDYVLEKVNYEMNAATDNPLIFAEEGQVISCGNFHGQPMALAFDFLGIALAELANSSERRIERLVNPSLSELPAFLTEKGGINSGFMIVQYTAAALVSENKILAHPASVDSIPSSGNQEDHVSMGTIAARKAYEILKNARAVIAIELMTAAQAVEFTDPGKLAKGTKEAYKLIRAQIPRLKEDRIMYPDIEKSIEMIRDNSILKAVEAAIGALI